MKRIEWHTEKRKISELKKWKENPRTISASAYKRLKDSIRERGFHDILKIDENNVVLSGNQRLDALKELGYEEVECKVSGEKLTKKQKDLVALESNNQDGEWDMDKLAEGFDDILEELGMGGLIPEEKKTEVEGEIYFSEELGEENNYIVIVFDNDIDWNYAKEVFGIKTVKAGDSKEGYERKGVGRIVKFKDVEDKII